MARRRPPRLEDALYIGVRRYFLTICCDERRSVLRDPAAREVVLSQRRHTSSRFAFAIFAYCLMPDHVHLVVEGQADDSNCLEFVRTLKQKTAFAWKQRTGHRLWQKSFHDHILRETETTQGVVRYVLENPVRAKLLRSPAEFAHSGSLLYDPAAYSSGRLGTRQSLRTLARSEGSALQTAPSKRHHRTVCGSYGSSSSRSSSTVSVMSSAAIA